jgi:hypothetical protein
MVSMYDKELVLDIQLFGFTEQPLNKVLLKSR